MATFYIIRSACFYFINGNKEFNCKRKNIDTILHEVDIKKAT